MSSPTSLPLVTKLDEEELMTSNPISTDTDIWNTVSRSIDNSESRSPNPSNYSASLLSHARSKDTPAVGEPPLDPEFERRGSVTIYTDMNAVAVPMCLIVFLSFVMRANGYSRDHWYDGFQEVITVLATWYPIIFASIMGRLMYQAARWKLEAGSSLYTLEQLMGSRTLESTFLTQFEPQTSNLLGLTLMPTWMLFPFGGQSMLRLLELWSATIDSTITYCGIGAPALFAEGTLFSSERLESISDCPVGNVSKGNTTFAFDASYIHLECTTPKKAQSGTAGSYEIAPYETVFVRNLIERNLVKS
ncbi:hypothetical protein B0J13DRAFT_635748 [Dactylonectria estremocensis]|uniref:Uncharacterized protein n=1 Tax=Dactylonectria estremocensis TaxID=1079267 RepID=A0A9P9EV60_9HYPO|nr:hypothetical protein B0J13DRAFT_635748 [Dactylonectria estremocensis]